MRILAVLERLAAAALASALIACTTSPAIDAASAPWPASLDGGTIVLLGEVHDSAEQHRLRLDALRRAVASGWRPAIVMEQFDRERQGDIDRARRERPGDAGHVIEQAATAPPRPGGGWNWSFYRPFVALALAHDLPLVAGNLSNADAAKIVRGGNAAVFDAAALRALGLDRPIEADWQRAQEREIDAGHCGALPAAMWPRVASAQFARDAVMADALRRHGGRGAVLLAGNGHVRKDIGVPRWLQAGGVWSVGYLERGDERTPEAAFDAVVRTAPVARGDPCSALRGRTP
ncbi:MAG TPA: ChaN family lipoprotein [Caldimonas sp.]|nr:ChaN family lipoprotein [Caldimonas sp.]HEX2541294.1 ChaN family lipoprotein [Caldimonas sp.]